MLDSGGSVQSQKKDYGHPVTPSNISGKCIFVLACICSCRYLQRREEGDESSGAQIIPDIKGKSQTQFSGRATNPFNSRVISPVFCHSLLLNKDIAYHTKFLAVLE